MSVTLTGITVYQPSNTVTFTGITVASPPNSVTITGITVQQSPNSVTITGITALTPDPTVVTLQRAGSSVVTLNRQGVGPVVLHRTLATPSPVGVSGNWSLIWSDEFDSDLDSSVWMRLRGSGAGYGNPYSSTTDDAAFSSAYTTVENGCLRIRWDATPITVSGTTYPYTTGIATTATGFSFTYGYMEARIWLPNVDGLWPAFWMLPLPVDSWPPEIDVSEWLFNTTTNVVEPHFNVHWGTSANPQQMGWQTYGTADAAGAWHLYGLLWQANKLQVVFDGIAGPSYTGAGVTSQAMYPIFSGGVRKGYTPPAGNMLVDYVRVWQ